MTSASPSPEPDLQSLAALRGGVLRSADVARLGITSHQLARLASAGVVTPLCRGWWMLGVPEGSRHAHRLLSRALAEQFAGVAWVSHTSGVLLAGLPVPSRLGPVHLTRERDLQTGRTASHVLHASIPGLDPVDRLAAAIVQTAFVSGGMAALCAADAALHQGRVTAEALGRAQELLAGHRGMPVARAYLRHADGRRESPGETRTAMVLRELGYRVQPQVELARDGITYRVDFLLDGEPVVIEFDGRIKYGDPQVLFAEKRREDEIRSWGYVVVRLTWDLLREPGRVRQRIEDARAQVRRRAG